MASTSDTSRSDRSNSWLDPTEIADILLSIFKYCESLELCHTVPLVCSTWNKTAKHNTIWHSHCSNLWKGKLYIINTAIDKRISRPYDAFKISYIDRKRNVISYYELTTIKWNFIMKYRSNVNNSDQVIQCQFGKDYVLGLPQYFGEFTWKFVKGHTWKHPKFYNKKDGINTCTEYGFTKHKNKKRFDKKQVKKAIKSGVKHLKQKLDISKSYFKEKVGLSEGRYIQVNEYPPLLVFRNKHWGYILENKWVIFTSY